MVPTLLPGPPYYSMGVRSEELDWTRISSIACGTCAIIVGTAGSPFPGSEHRDIPILIGRWSCPSRARTKSPTILWAEGHRIYRLIEG
jgi:hypothetical protein